MSTAGKVLVVLVMLTTLAWMILAAGVSQLNVNGNKRLQDIADQLANLQVDVGQAQVDLVAVRDQTASVQESTDREAAVLRSRQTDLEKARSQIRESLARNQYQLEIVQDTIKKAKSALQNRVDEQEGEVQAVAKAKSEVKDLMAKTGELRNQLVALRKEFQTKYHANIESLGTTR
jgi:chromosome segregation ATPase